VILQRVLLGSLLSIAGGFASVAHAVVIFRFWLLAACLIVCSKRENRVNNQLFD
jgi:hypothetical protein